MMYFEKLLLQLVGTNYAPAFEEIDVNRELRSQVAEKLNVEPETLRFKTNGDHLLVVMQYPGMDRRWIYEIRPLGWWREQQAETTGGIGA
jgi:hypothetical protein